MTTLGRDYNDVLRAALAEYSLPVDTIEPLTGGAVNAHWKVAADGRIFALRRYRSRHHAAGIPYEHLVLAHMAARGWPVAAPLPAVDGRTLVEVDGQRFSLFPFLPGKPVYRGDAAFHEDKGRLLARLHRDLATVPITGQRPGFARVTDLDTWIAPDRFSTVAGLLTWVAGQDAPLANAIRREQQENGEELHQLGFAQMPDTLVHFECYSGNLLFDHGRLSGVLDFDFVHQDARVSDIGRSAAIDCAGDGGIDPARLTAFLTGYLQEAPLSRGELDLVAPLLRANLLWMAVLPLSIWAAGDPAPYVLPSARHAAFTALPALAVRRPALEDAVQAAASAAGLRNSSGQCTGPTTDGRQCPPFPAPGQPLRPSQRS